MYCVVDFVYSVVGFLCCVGTWCVVLWLCVNVVPYGPPYVWRPRPPHLLMYYILYEPRLTMCAAVGAMESDLGVIF